MRCAIQYTWACLLLVAPFAAQTFSAPKKFIQFNLVPTPGEYALTKPLAAANGPSGVALLRLGALGRTFLVSGGSPTPNGPLTIYVLRDGQFRDVFDGQGFDVEVLDSAGPVPDLATAWKMRGMEADLTLYHWNGSHFVAAVCEKETDESFAANFSDAHYCDGSGPAPTFKLPESHTPERRFTALDALEYNRAREVLGTRVTTAGWRGAHGVEVNGGSPGDSAVIKTAECDMQRNCKIFVLQHVGDSYLLAMDGMRGFGVAQVDAPPSFPDAMNALVIAAHLDRGGTEYRLYIEAPNFRPNTSDWQLATCELDVRLKLHSVPCTPAIP